MRPCDFTDIAVRRMWVCISRSTSEPVFCCHPRCVCSPRNPLELRGTRMHAQCTLLHGWRQMEECLSLYPAFVRAARANCAENSILPNPYLCALKTRHCVQFSVTSVATHPCVGAIKTVSRKEHNTKSWLLRALLI